MTTKKRSRVILLTVLVIIALTTNVVITEAATKTTQTSKKTSSKKKSKKKKKTSKKKGKKVTFRATAYCPCYSCSEGWGHSTASGARAKEYHTIAASSAYPLGTKVYIPYFKKCKNKGWFVVEDRGGAVRGNTIDIFFESHAKTNQFGVKNLKAYVYPK